MKNPSSITSRTELELIAAICAIVSCAVLLTFSHRPISANPASRVATMDALVHDRTFVIDKSLFRTIDRVVLDKHSYSSKPPMFSTLGAGVYWALHHGFGLSLRDTTTRENTLYLLALILGGLPHLLILLYGHKCLRWFAPDPASAALALVCLALGQLGLSYSTSINNHVPSAAAVMAAFYYAFGLRRGHLVGRRYFCYAGFAAGLAPTLDLGAIFLSAGIAVYLLSWDFRRTFVFFAAAALVPVVANFGLTWYVMGSPMPVYLRHELYNYPGSYWLHPVGNDAKDEPRLTYLFNILVGHHGLLSMTPVVLFGVYAMVRSGLLRDNDRAIEAAAIGVPLLAMIAFYTFTTKNYGGACAGFRWFLPALPPTLLFVAHASNLLRRRAGFLVFALCLLVSQYHVCSALQNPWGESSWEKLLAAR
jgi:hypothetical protein